MYSSDKKRYVLMLGGVVFLCILAIVYLKHETLSLLFNINRQSAEVHVHSDFAFYVLGTAVDLTGEQYQSSSQSIKHQKMHFHDSNDNVIHRHASGITFSEFMSSIGFTVTDTCLTMDTEVQYCTVTENILRLYVNGKPQTNIGVYIPKEEDKILLYYGDPTSSDLLKFQEAITDDSCLYSGNCPERGEPPTESCGLTCEL